MCREAGAGRRAVTHIAPANGAGGSLLAGGEEEENNGKGYMAEFVFLSLSLSL